MDGDSKAERALWVSARETQLRAAGGGPWKREGRGWSPTLRLASCPRHRGPVHGSAVLWAGGVLRKDLSCLSVREWWWAPWRDQSRCLPEPQNPGLQRRLRWQETRGPVKRNIFSLLK